MGESACVLQTFSHGSDSVHEANEGNPMHALGESVSFGRFMSETLAWEKWSSFNQNRYLEEVEKYSKPGSVAQKKAYFEAHYKRKAAAALLEQENAADTVSQPETNDSVQNDGGLKPELNRSNCGVTINEQSEPKVFNDKADFDTDDVKKCNSVEEMRDLEIIMVKEADLVELVIDKQVFVEDTVEIELEIRQEDCENYNETEVHISTTKQIEKSPLKESFATNQESPLKVKTEIRKPGTPSSKSSVHSRASKIISSSPAWPKTPIFPRKEINSTPHGAKTVRDCPARPRTPVHPRKENSCTPHGTKTGRDCPAWPRTPVHPQKENRSTPHGTKTGRDCPARPRTPVHPRNENSSTPHGTKTGRDCPARPRTPVLPRKDNSSTPHNTKAARDFPARTRTPLLSRKESSSVSHNTKTVRDSPARPRTPVLPRKENSSTSHSTQAVRDSADKLRSISKSLHMSINFTSSSYRVGEANKLSSPFLQKMKSKDCSTPAQTPARASAKALPKLRPETPQQETSRIKMPVEHEVSGSKKVDVKWQSLSIE
ncbi:hypothetical protein GIB67_018764 [Kingdonia uniflora]|uniref:TPX2 C-terminal domain-containing protein n=1 Tax=Kingdonia uniflora TaxID=39325 RepID=A0A7J7NE90_9MAGN|nr:hypothetical protein GIB67_018764 [Kingdonia uniflora]